MNQPSKLLILVGSPRRTGNSATLAGAVQRGAEAAGTQVSLRFVDDFISSFLRDCRTCRLPSGECAIKDRFRSVLFNDFLPADGVSAHPFIGMACLPRLKHFLIARSVITRHPTQTLPA